MFAVDDVTYDGVAMTPTGYCVYKNGQRVATLSDEATGYTDAEGTESDVYQVTVVYAEGESAFSNAASVAATGIQTDAWPRALPRCSISITALRPAWEDAPYTIRSMTPMARP